jgi:hypothetical protein
MLLKSAHNMHGVAGQEAVPTRWPFAAAQPDGVIISRAQMPYGLSEHMQKGLLQQ